MGYRKLGRNTGHRRAMLRNLVTSLLDKERIETTETRAKEVRSLAEKMITLAKRGDLHARRQALAYVLSESVVSKLFSDIATRYEERPGGYTRMVKLEPRRGDNAPMCILELV
ncbi:MAG: 50S ribosomal protein L17 [Symbiobacteriaceae bacterium]|nr:50S ribosomal protein L17 [Symbiobacteriaceae bacterium]